MTVFGNYIPFGTELKCSNYVGGESIFFATKPPLNGETFQLPFYWNRSFMLHGETEFTLDEKNEARTSCTFALLNFFYSTFCRHSYFYEWFSPNYKKMYLTALLWLPNLTTHRIMKVY